MKANGPSPASTYLFTLRLWAADVGSGETEWRGRLQLVTTGEVRYFRDWETMVAHLREMLEQASAQRAE